MTFRPMHCIVALAIACAALPAFAQKVVIENQGEASKSASAQMLTVEAVEKDIGKAPAGRAQVVFFRSSKSPGESVAVRDAAGGQSLIDLEPDTYFIATSTPGPHAYATPDKGPFSMDLDAGRTYYVQAIRNKKGGTELIRSSAEKFARAANH